MIFGLGRLFYVILLLINAVAVLSEERFLRRSMFEVRCHIRPNDFFLCHYCELLTNVAFSWSWFGKKFKWTTSLWTRGEYNKIKGYTVNWGYSNPSKKYVSFFLYYITIIVKIHEVTNLSICFITVPLIGINILVIGYELLLG